MKPSRAFALKHPRRLLSRKMRTGTSEWSQNPDRLFGFFTVVLRNVADVEGSRAAEPGPPAEESLAAGN